MSSELREHAAPVSAPPPAFEVAPQQRGLWYLQQLVPECGAYHLVFCCEAHHRAELPAGAATLLSELLQDLPVLRVGMTQTERGPLQQAWPRVQPTVLHHDVSGMDDASLRERIRLECRQPFDLAQPPLWRVALYHRDAQRCVIAATAHHVLLDFWSLGLLLQEVAARLDPAHSSGPRADGSSFLEDARAQAQRLGDPQQTASWHAYWQPQLAGAPPVHGMPLDMPRAALQSYSGRSVTLTLGQATSAAVKALAQRANATPFMVLYAAYCVLLHRYSGDTDLLVATPVAGRTARRQRHVLGQYVNTVLLRSRPQPHKTFAVLVAEARTTVIEALRHQECAFAWLVQQLAPQRDPSYAPLAQLGFSWERLPFTTELAELFLPDPPPLARHVAGVRLTPFTVMQQEGQLELLLEMGGERDGAFIGVLKYDDTLFTAATARELATAFVAIVAELLARPEAPLAELHLCDPDQITRVLQLGRGVALPLPNTDALQLIEAQVLARPQALAVASAAESLTYAQLWLRAGVLATRLIESGVQPQGHVGVMLERGVDLVTAVLGIWSAGALYVPLDPSFPSARLAHIGTDAALQAVVSHSVLRGQWPVGVPAVCLNQSSQAQPLVCAQAGPGAYLLYTSGSTGRPKGVRVAHRAVLNFLLAMQQQLHFDHDTRLVAITTLAFDISVLELLLPLLAGGSVHVCDRDTAADGVLLGRYLEDCAANVLQATPSTWKLLLDTDWGGKPDLVALCGGEPLPQSLEAALQPRVGALWNLYGPTETTVWSSAARLEPGERVHLGSPLANTQLYVLDAQRRPVPPGVLGELWIGGEGLALDYWQNAELTAERFTELAELPSAGRVYRTGDRVRWTAGGRLEHHGRLDSQVKLRGYRIELGEIESLLTRCAGVRDAAVIVREDRPGDARLVAYVAADAGAEPTAGALRLALRDQLPAFMIPASFVFLADLPLTPNRKVDRRALPAPQASAVTILVAPRDALEIQLATLFCNLLGLSQVGVHDSFFDLGGHSLLAVQLVAGIKRRLGVELPVAALVQYSTIAALAARLRSLEDLPVTSVLILKSARDVQPLWLFHPIGGNVFCYLELTRHLRSDRAVLAVQAPGLDESDATEVTLEALVARHLREVRAVQPHGPYLLGGWCFGGVLAFEMARQLLAAGERVTGLTLIDTRAPIKANVPSDADDATLMSWFARDLAIPFNQQLQIPPQALRALQPEAMLEHVLTAAKAMTVLPEDTSAEQMQRYFEVYLAGGMALQTYFPEPLAVPALLLLARDEPATYGPTLGWNELIHAGLTLEPAPGDHSSVMYAPHASSVAHAIDRHYSVQSLPGFLT